MSRATPRKASSSGPTHVEREADALRDSVDQARRHLDLADRPHGSRTGVAGQPLELEHALRQHRRRVETEVHGRGARVVAAAVDGHVSVHVAGDGADDADAVAGVLEHPRLLDVHLDPAGQAVEDVGGLPPEPRLEAGLLGVLPEAAPVVDRPETLPEVVVGDALGDDPAPQQHLSEARALLLEERDQPERQAEPQLVVEPADLERRDDTHGSVVLAAVAVRVAVRADPEGGLARRPVARDERADRSRSRTRSRALASSRTK